MKQVWEYRAEADLDFLNTAVRCSGADKLNELAKDGWEPFMILEFGALGFKTRILLRRIKV